GPGSLQLPNSDVAILHVSLESARFARRRPLQADGTSLLPLRLSGIGRIVRHVADLLSIQGDGDMRALGRDLQVIPLLFLPKTRELVVAGVEPEHAVLRPEPFRRDAVDDDADVFHRFATADVHLIAGAERDAAVVRAGLVDACVRLLRSGALRRALGAVLRELEVQLESEVLELFVGDEASAPAALTPDQDAVLDLPVRRRRIGTTASRGDRPSRQVLAVEKRLPVSGRRSGS